MGAETHVTRGEPKLDDEEEEAISTLNGFADYKAHVCPHQAWPPGPNVYIYDSYTKHY